MRKKNHGRTRQATDKSTLRRMRLACWIPKAANTHKKHAIRTAFLRYQQLHLRASILRSTCIACLRNSHSMHAVLKITIPKSSNNSPHVANPSPYLHPDSGWSLPNSLFQYCSALFITNYSKTLKTRHCTYTR